MEPTIRILVVWRHEDILNALERIVRRTPRVEARGATDARAAMALLDGWTPDVIFADKVTVRGVLGDLVALRRAVEARVASGRVPLIVRAWGVPLMRGDDGETIEVDGFLPDTFLFERLIELGEVLLGRRDPASTDFALRPRRVLIADEDVSARRDLVQGVFAGDCCEIREAENGAGALAQLDGWTPDGPPA